MPRFDAMCGCGHLAIHHLARDEMPCIALAGDCPCRKFEEARP